MTKILSEIPIKMSNSLDPDKARRGHDLGPNCLPRLTADVTGRQRVNITFVISVVSLKVTRGLGWPFDFIVFCLFVIFCYFPFWF